MAKLGRFPETIQAEIVAGDPAELNLVALKGNKACKHIRVLKIFLITLTDLNHKHCINNIFMIRYCVPKEYPYRSTTNWKSTIKEHARYMSHRVPVLPRNRDCYP